MGFGEKAEDIIDLRGQEEIGPSGQKTRKYTGTRRPPGIDTQVWNRFYSKKEKAKLSKQYEDWLEARRAELRAGSAAGEGESSAAIAAAAPHTNVLTFLDGDVFTDAGKAKALEWVKAFWFLEHG